MTKIKSFISSFIKSLMFYTGIFSLIRILFPRNQVAILRYHSVANFKDSPHTKNYTTPSISIDPVDFEKHVKYFSTHCKIISLDKAVNCFQKEIPLPRNSVVFTFDDGYADNYNAYKILKKYGATGTFYVTAGCIDNKSPLWLAEVRQIITRLEQTGKGEFSIKIGDETKPTQMKFNLSNSHAREEAIREITAMIKSHDIQTREDILSQLRQAQSNAQIADTCYSQSDNPIMLTWTQLKEMREDGMTISSHTMTHCNLPNARYEDATAELSASKALLEKELGVPVKHFSYPNNGPYEYYNEMIKEAVKAAGYLSATTSAQGLATMQSDLFELQRIRTTPNLPALIYSIEVDERFIRTLVQGMRKLRASFVTLISYKGFMGVL